MQQPNRTCQICGTPYYACHNCEKVNSPRIVTDKNECYFYYIILTELRQGVISKDEAKRKLIGIGCNLTSLKRNAQNFLPEVYDVLVDILKSKSIETLTKEEKQTEE